jgi:hypothetical protein
MLNLDANSLVERIIKSRGVDYERAVGDRRERERARKREARQRLTKEQREQECKRKQAARQRQTHEQRAREKAREKARSRAQPRPFIAIDGEGGGTDELDRQHYFLMVASGQTAGEERICHREGKSLSTRDCLDFILSLPANVAIVGYGIGYDATQVLRGIKASTLRQILNPRQGKNGPCYTYWGDYAIIYQQGQYIRIARVGRSGGKPSVIKGSSRTIYETFGFFQCSFVKAINNWEIGAEQEREFIAENKMQRDQFVKITDEIIEYSKLVCRYLAMLMTAFRDICTAAGILPRQWSGAGWLAAALLEKHSVPKRPLIPKELEAQAERKPGKNSWPMALRRPERDRQFEIAANRAYYGGR